MRKRERYRENKKGKGNSHRRWTKKQKAEGGKEARLKNSAVVSHSFGSGLECSVVMGTGCHCYGNHSAGRMLAMEEAKEKIDDEM